MSEQHDDIGCLALVSVFLVLIALLIVVWVTTSRIESLERRIGQLEVQVKQ